eukprot:SAG22_NODE_232_length_14402_cov_58.042159_5_plen_273_part_00
MSGAPVAQCTYTVSSLKHIPIHCFGAIHPPQLLSTATLALALFSSLLLIYNNIRVLSHHRHPDHSNQSLARSTAPRNWQIFSSILSPIDRSDSADCKGGRRVQPPYLERPIQSLCGYERARVAGLKRVAESASATTAKLTAPSIFFFDAEFRGGTRYNLDPESSGRARSRAQGTSGRGGSPFRTELATNRQARSLGQIVMCASVMDWATLTHHNSGHRDAVGRGAPDFRSWSRARAGHGWMEMYGNRGVDVLLSTQLVCIARHPNSYNMTYI